LEPDVYRVLAADRSSWQIEQARNHLLRVISELAPEVLSDLSLLHPEDDAGIREWASRHRLSAEWVLVVARNTLMLWSFWPKGRGRVWECNHIEQGWLVPERGRLPESRRPKELLIVADHFQWLVRHRVLGERFSAITTPAQTSQKAVTALAMTLGLSRIHK
jgi:hypothetical protein